MDCMPAADYMLVMPLEGDNAATKLHVQVSTRFSACMAAQSRMGGP